MFDLEVNPFTEDVFSGTLDTEPTLDGLYAHECTQLLGAAESLHQRPASFGRGSGHGALLVSPKAGAGKTHLLARLAQHGSAVHVCRMAFNDPDEMCWTTWCRELVMSYHRAKDLQSDHNVLTGRIAFVLANTTSELISEGAIPCESPATASSWLSEHSRKLFDPNEASDPSVQWFKSEYDSLLPRVVQRHARSMDVDASVLSTWLDGLFHYATLSTGEGSVSDHRAAQEAFLLEEEGLLGSVVNEATAKEVVRMFGLLMTSELPLIFAVDDLDWFYRDEASALRLARMLSEFSKWVPRCLALISVNEDTWSETFVKGLPEAVRDRLATHTITLKGVPRSLWKDFLACRAEPSDVEVQDVDRVFQAVLANHGEEATLMPRKLIREAAMAWSTEVPETLEEESKEAVQVIAAEEPESTTQVVESPAEEPSESVKESERSDDASASLWVNAMGDIRNLIDSRQSKTMTTSSGHVAEKGRASIPEKPQLTAEFRSFLSSLRARSQDKKSYEPQGGKEVLKDSDPPKSETTHPTRTRNDLIMHGKSVGSAQETVALPVAAGRREMAPWVVARLREFKATMVGSDELGRIHLGRLRHLITTGGEQFPAVEQDFPSTKGNPAGVRWRFQQSEVHFGFEPYRHETFWQRLVQDTASRARDLRESEKTRVKLVVFKRSDDPSPFASWSHKDSESMDLQFCDVVSLSEAHLLTLYSIEQMLTDETDAQRRDDTFLQLSGELDFFWKMVTRPVWTVVSQFSKDPASVVLQ